MDIIEELTSLELTIKKVYLKLIELENNNDDLEYENYINILTRLITKENEIFNKIIKDTNKLVELNNLLTDNYYNQCDTYDEIFKRNLTGKYEPLIMIRIHNKLNSFLIYLDNEQVSELGDDELLISLDISLDKLEELTLFSWSTANIINNTSSKLEYCFLNDKLEDESLSKETREGLLYYKHLLVYANPFIEKYLLGINKPTQNVPDIFKDYDNYSWDYKKVLLYNIEQSIIKNIDYIIKLMFCISDYSEYLYNKEVMNIIYLAGIESYLNLLSDKVLEKTIINIDNFITKQEEKIGKEECLLLKELINKFTIQKYQIKK